MEFYIKEADDKIGLPVHTLRYYEQEGLLHFIKRDANGNRIYDELEKKYLNEIENMSLKV